MHIEVILKITERCNLDCSYCYFFHMENQSYADHPAYMSLGTIREVARFLANAVHTHGLQSITINLHGGEPLMIGKARFKAACQVFVDTIIGCKLDFSVQTNATLIDAEWIAIFSQYGIRVGVSLDGPPVYNDINRLDKKQRGTHDAVVRSVQLLHEAVARQQITEIGIICVINPFHMASHIYRHFVNSLGLKKLHFILPDKHHGNYDHSISTLLTSYLIDLFQAWVQDDNPEIEIRLFQQMAYAMVAGAQGRQQIQTISRHQMAITIASNGDLCPDDTLRNVLVDTFNQAPNVRQTDLQQFILWQAKAVPPSQDIPTDCQLCQWQSVCHTYYQYETKLHQFHPETGFNHPSVYCVSLQPMYQALFDYLAQHSTSEQYETLAT